MKEQLIRHAKFARRLYLSTLILSSLLLSAMLPLEAMQKVPPGTTGNSTEVAIVIIDKTRKMHLDAQAALNSDKKQ